MRPLLHALLFALAAPAAAPQGAAPPPVAREFRGAWVASVANIDWPSKPGLNAWQQKSELIAILDRAVELNFNAILLQVRPAADALYDSPYEPWSAYLTGVEARAPEPYYDPLRFAVSEAHARGLERTPVAGATIAWWTVRAQNDDGRWRTWILPSAQTRLIVSASAQARPKRVVVTAVDRLGNESAEREVVRPH